MADSPYASTINSYLTATNTKAISGLDANPDEAARAIDLSDATGVPPEVITADQEGFEKQHQQMLVSQMIGRNSQLRAYINSHPLAADVSNDDWGNLDTISRSAGKTSQMLQTLNKPLSAGFNAAWEAAGEQLTQPIPHVTSEEMAKLYPALDPSKGLLPRISNLLATGELNVASAAIGIGSNIFGALTAGVGAGVGAAAKRLGIPQAGASIDVPGIGPLRVGPGGPEQLGRDIQGMAEYEMIKPEGKLVHKPTAEPTPLIAGQTWMAAGKEPPPSIHPEYDMAKAQINQLALDQLDQELALAQQSLTKERSPELFQKFVEQHYGRSTIGISGDAAVALYGDKPPEPGDGLLGWVPNIAHQLDRARTTGGDIEIPVADWISKADPSVAKTLRDDTRVWPGGITAREAAGIEPVEMVGAPIAQVRGAAGLEPAFAWGDRKLTMAPKAPGEFDLIDGRGQPQGKVQVAPDPQGNLIMNWDAGTGLAQPNTFGPAMVLDLMRQMKEMYPEAKVVIGPGGKVTIPDTGKPMSPKTFESARRVMGQPLGAAPVDRPSIEGEFERVNPAVADLDKKTAANLERQIQERYERDVEEAEARAARIQAKRQTKEWKDNRKALRPEVEDSLRQRPDVAADLFLGNGELYGQKLRQRYTLRADDLTPEQKAVLPNHYVSKNGLPIDEVARIFGYGSGDAMIDHLAAYLTGRGERSPKEMLSQLVDDETDRLMEARYGNLGENILTEAKDQALSEQSLNLLAEEYYAAGMKSGAQTITKEAAREQARTQLAQIPISTINSDKTMALMGKHARDAERALINGDPATAFVSMQRKYFSAVLAAEERKIEKQIDSFDKLAKQISKREVASIPPENLNFAHQILMKIGKPVRRSVQDLAKEISAGEAKNLKDFVDIKTAMLQEMPVWPELFDDAWRKSYDNLTVEEFNAVSNSVKTIIHNGKAELKLIRAGESIDYDVVRSQLVEQLRKFPLIEYVDEGGTERVGGGGIVGKVLRTFGSSHMIVETILNHWDQMDERGPWNQYVIRDLIRDANQEDAWRKTYAKRLAEAEDKVDLKKSVDNPLFRQPTAAGDGPLLRLNRGHLRAVMLNVGTQLGPKSNLWKFANGWGLEPDEVMAWVHQHATKEDWDFCQKVWDIFADIKEKSDTMYRSLSGVPAEDVPVTPIQTRFGTYKGGYYPIIYHDTFKGTSKKLMGRDPLEQNNYVRATTPAGYTVSRTGYTAPIALDLDRMPARIAQMLHDISMRPSVLNASKVFYDPMIQREMLNHAGKETADLMIPYLRDVANSANYKSQAQSDFTRWSEFIRQNMVSTLVGLNPGTVMKHGLTALVQSMQEVGPMEFLRATKGLFSINETTGERNFKFAHDNSLELQRRSRNYVETLTGATESLAPSTGFEGLRQRLIRYASTPVAISDMVSAYPTWLARYNKAIGEGMDHGDAVASADRAVRRAHGSTAVTNRPAVMRDRSPWITSVYTFFNHIMNRQAELIWKSGEMLGHVKDHDYKAAMAMVPGISAQLFAYVLFPAMVEEAVSPLPAGGQENWAKKAAKGVAFTLGSSWVGVRDLSSAYLAGRDPTVGIYSSALESVTQLARDFGKNEPLSREHAGRVLQDAMTLGGLTTGLMTEAEGKAARFAYGVHAGVEHPRGPWGWLTGLRYGTLKHHSSTFQNYIHGKDF